MEKLLQLLLEEAESEQQGYWYTHGYEAEQSALGALMNVIKRVQYRLEEEK